MSGVRRALISVSDKSGIAEFAQALAERGFELLSTGGTAKTLRQAGLNVTDVSEITGFPEIMDGRVKTLHPRIHGGLLGRRDQDAETMAEHEILPIELICVNLYPFEQTVAQADCSLEEAVENIDIGGPAMIRAAAKNHAFVAVVVDPDDYETVIGELDGQGISEKTRRRLAQKAFGHTACYDTAIWSWLRQYREDDSFPKRMPIALTQNFALRYGENPHQRASLYSPVSDKRPGPANAVVHQGKELSYNNLADADAAVDCVMSFQGSACVIVKHANPCGVGLGEDLAVAYRRAFATDPESAFGGIIALNEILTQELAQEILDNQFLEVIIAPGFEPAALNCLQSKPNVRVLETSPQAPGPGLRITQLAGGMLVQDRDIAVPEDLQVVTERQPSEAERHDAAMAWEVCRHVKSNAIVYCRDGATIGIGAGQMSRVMSVRIAGWKAEEAGLSTQGAAMASDAFFPFRDGLDRAAEHGVTTVIQPGGSVRDDEVIAAANEHNMAMIFTGLRHFRH